MLQRVHFGKTARQKARLQRIWLGISLATMVAAAVNMPTGDPAENLLNRLVRADREQLSLSAKLAGVEMDTPKRPTPRAAETTPAASPTPRTVTEIIYDAAAEFGLSGSYLLGVANCESHVNPYAYNAAGYHGLFQFDSTTWAAYGYGDIYDAEAQARTAARLLAAGHASRWPNCA